MEIHEIFKRLGISLKHNLNKKQLNFMTLLTVDDKSYLLHF